MAVTIGSNVSSLRTIRQLDGTTRNLAATSERLASGQRINRASDDAAGLSVSSILNSSGRVYHQAVRNVNDGISLLNVAEGALQQLTGVVERQRELAAQASNGTFSYRQRLQMQAEVDALNNEYNRIVEGTRYNQLRLLDGSTSTTRIQQGFGIEESLATPLGMELGRVAGSGSFTLTASYATVGDSLPSDTVLADYNNDGLLDVVVTQSQPGFPAGTTFSLALGRGDGTFGAQVTFATNYLPSLALSGDFNNDGNLDLATTGGNNSVSLHFGNGDGTFKTRVSFQLSSAPFSIKAGDLNSDGSLDLVVSDNSGASINTYLNSGAGAFSLHSQFGLTNDYANLAIGDLNGDGKNDIAASHSLYNFIYLNNGDGTFRIGVSFNTTNGEVDTPAIADLDGDGKQDLVTARTSSDQFLFYYGQGDGVTFTETGFVSLGSNLGANRLMARDLNDDGHLDLIATNVNAQSSIILGNGDRTFRAGVTPADSTIYLGALGDVNSDGVLDLVGADFFNSTLRVLQGGTDTSRRVNTIDCLSINSIYDARQAFFTLDNRSADIRSEMVALGALRSRLETSSHALQARELGYADAASRITDADVAQESAALVRYEILQQTASGVLAQANQQPRIAIQLLGAI